MMDVNYWKEVVSSKLILVTALFVITVHCVVTKIFPWLWGKIYDVTEERSSGEYVSSDDVVHAENNSEHIPYKPIKYSQDEMIERSRRFYNILDGRRSVRYFSDEHVPMELINNIVHTAGTSPSGAHMEPWTFVVVKDNDIKAKIREIIEREEEINYKQRMGDKWVKDLEPLNVNWVKEYLTTVPYIIVVFKQVYGTHPTTGERQTTHYHEISVSIACGLLISAIHFAGLATLTSTPLNAGTQLRDLLNRPANEKVVILCPVGYPSSDCLVPQLKRKALDNIMVVI